MSKYIKGSRYLADGPVLNEGLAEVLEAFEKRDPKTGHRPKPTGITLSIIFPQCDYPQCKEHRYSGRYCYKHYREIENKRRRKTYKKEET